MGLGEKEIQLLITKLRERYADYAARYNPRWFNRDAFEERLKMAVDHRMDLEGFILAEITNFEKIREKYEQKKNEKPFSVRVEQIMEENITRIKKYPEVLFHPQAGLEMRYFYGALNEFALSRFPVLWLVLKDQALRGRLQKFEEALAFLAVADGKRYPKRIEDHILVLTRTGRSEIEVERDNNNYLKESAFLLHEIMDFCEGLLARREKDWESPLAFDKLFIEGERKKSMVACYSGYTGYGAILKVKEWATQIVEDFRLGAFRRK